ncbi:MAG: PfkB family carbohydrate kinase, partial [Ghiorsea sp.]|nr:PfkB family carbohydrate kinase [Ghiorsea sp.]
RDVFDVTGAGDTVIAVFTASLARGKTPLEAAKTANFAAGVVVGKVGTATADWQEIETMANA